MVVPMTVWLTSAVPLVALLACAGSCDSLCFPCVGFMLTGLVIDSCSPDVSNAVFWSIPVSSSSPASFSPPLSLSASEVCRSGRPVLFVGPVSLLEACNAAVSASPICGPGAGERLCVVDRGVVVFVVTIATSVVGRVRDDVVVAGTLVEERC